ncbi:MAG TPA: hypothetical protein VFK49_00670 [Stellaceae bacterium]|nr:hypothetical protein [Stellaceae bacterium]
MEPLPTAARIELAEFLHRQAEECVQLARGQPAPLASELLALAAMLHERAVRLKAACPGAAREGAVD